MNTKEKIFLTAQKLFFQKGIERTSVKEISEKANINIAALNYHYKSKENLVDIIVEKIVNDFSPSLSQILCSDLHIETKIKDYIFALNNLLPKIRKKNIFIYL